MVPPRLSRLAFTAIAALPIVSGAVAPTSAGPPEVIAELEYTPATVAPGDTVAVTGRCLTNGAPTQVAHVLAGHHEEGPPAEDLSLEVVYPVDIDGDFSGGFVIPSNVRAGDWSINMLCLTGDAVYGTSDPAPLTVAGEPGGPFSIDVQLSPDTILAGDELQVTGRCINDGLPLETARLQVPGLWPDLYTPDVSVDTPVSADGTFAAGLTYPVDGQAGEHAVVLSCHSGDDVIAETAYAPFAVREPIGHVDHFDLPPATPTPVPAVDYTG